MSFNLMEAVKNRFTSDFTNNASSALDESSTGISKALSAIIPTGLAGILTKATSGTDGANSIFDIATNTASNLSGNDDLTGNENIQKGNSILSSLFAGNQSGIMSTISRFSGIKESSASSLMSMGLPVIMDILGKHAEQNNLSASGLAGFLSSEKDHIVNALPAGLSSVIGIIGLGSGSATATNIKSRLDDTLSDVTAKPGKSNWLVPLIIIVAALALLFFLSRSCNQTRPSTATDEDNTMIINPHSTLTASAAITTIRLS
ncbi:MAG: DUF937 domain-containing protein [Ginsengibacter sp.]